MLTTVRRSLPLLALGLALVATGCAGKSGRVMDRDEPVGTDIKQAGVDVLDGMMQEGTRRILADAAARMQGSTDRHRLVFAGIQNNSDERLGEKKDYIYDNVDALITNHGSFDVVSRTFVENVLAQLGESPRTELLIDPAVRSNVVQRFQQMEPRDYIRYILWAKFNVSTSEVAKDEFEKKYNLVLEMVDVRTGLQMKQVVDSRKAYTR